MPIEFSCPQCGSLLRTPDASVGKKAKCPSCGTVSDVPAGSGGTAPAASAGEALPLLRPEGDPFQLAGSIPAGPAYNQNPFADPAGSPFGAQKPAPENPYATPVPTLDMYAPAAAQRELVPTRIDFGHTLRASWKIYTENLGLLLLLALMLIGLVILTYVVLGGLVFGVLFTAGQGQPGPGVMLILIPLVLVLAVGALVAYSWIEAGLALVSVAVCRGGPVQFNDVFSGGRFTLQLFLLNVLRAVINVAIGAVFGLIGGLLAAAMRHEAYGIVGSLAGNIVNYVVTLLLLLTTYFIVDRNLGVIEALGASVRFMSGNKLTVFAIHIVAGICTVLAVLLTCGIGAIFVMPFFLVLTAAMYLLATGQTLARYVDTAGK